MFSHITIGTNDIASSRQFYNAVMSTIGHDVLSNYDEVATSYGIQGEQLFFLLTPLNGEPATAGNGTTIGLSAPNRASVDAFYAAAMANKGADEGEPGLREHYHSNYYAAYVRDPDGNKLCVVCHKPE